MFFKYCLKMSGYFYSVYLSCFESDRVLKTIIFILIFLSSCESDRVVITVICILIFSVKYGSVP